MAITIIFYFIGNYGQGKLLMTYNFCWTLIKVDYSIILEIFKNNVH
jgi:hypothetical protein